MSGQLYYIQCRRHGVVGNCVLWWGPDKGGYVCDLDKAGKYPKEEADEISRSTHGQDVPRAVADMDAISIRHVHANTLSWPLATPEQLERGAP
ncbi:MAG: hypothetical protein GY906_22340 [bacterium]|nr:hypothetical protein [bacterium]